MLMPKFVIKKTKKLMKFYIDNYFCIIFYDYVNIKFIKDFCFQEYKYEIPDVFKFTCFISVQVLLQLLCIKQCGIVASYAHVNT